MVVVVVGVSKCIKNYYILLLLPKRKLIARKVTCPILSREIRK